MGSKLEAAITASFSTLLPYILIGNMIEITGGAYECLIGYLNNYSVWSPSVPEGSSGLKSIFRDGVKTVAGRVRKLRATVTAYADLKDF